MPPVPLRENVAVAVLLEVMETSQVPVPLHAPLQPVKVEPSSGLAERLTVVPSLYDSEQSVPQFIPEGELVTVPVPVPLMFTVRVYRVFPGTAENVALQNVLLFIVTAPSLQSLSPLQPAKKEPGSGVAVSETTVPPL